MRQTNYVTENCGRSRPRKIWNLKLWISIYSYICIIVKECHNSTQIYTPKNHKSKL